VPLTARVLAHLEEIERRRLHLEGHSSLFSFCLKELGYSENEANARISAMRLYRELPEVIPAVETGALCLTNLVKAQAFFNQEKKAGKPVSLEEKRELLQEIQGSSTRECERLLAERSPLMALPQDRERALFGQHTQVSFTAGKRLMEDLERIRALWGHEGHLSYAELIQKMAGVVLDQIDPLRRASRLSEKQELREKRQRAEAQKTEKEKPQAPTETNKSPGSQRVPHANDRQRDSSPTLINCASSSDANVLRADSDQTSSPLKNLSNSDADAHALNPPPEFLTPTSRHIPEAVRRAVWVRDQGRCTHRYAATSGAASASPSPSTPPSPHRSSVAPGERCRSIFALDVDHIIHYAHGGRHTVDNLRLLCRAHHSMRTARSLRNKMSA
jgi:hypothetical protein